MVPPQRHLLLLLALTCWLTDAAATGTQAVVQDDGQLPLDPQPCARDASDPRWARFCAWLADYCGASGLESVFIGEFAKGTAMVRGIGAQRDMAKGEFVVCVPKTCWATEGDESDRIRQLTPQGCDGDARLALHIAEEKAKGENSPLAIYWQMLPSEDDYRRFHPAYLSGFRLAPDIDYWASWETYIKDCYTVYKQSAGDSAVSYTEAYLAYVQLLTRRYGNVDLVPLADLPNTAPESELNLLPAYNDTEAMNFCIQASKDISKGDELLVSYGAHSATLMFALYGFAFAPEHHDPAANGFPEGADIDPCAGLRPEDFTEPGPEAGPILQNYWRFAAVHCARGGDEAPGGSHVAEEAERGAGSSSGVANSEL